MTCFESGGACEQGRDPAVLLVEDEIMIRLSVAEALRDAGICVVEAECGAEALAVLSSSMEIDLLITDITMPGEPDGLGLAEACRAMRPGVGIILASARLPEPGDPRADKMLAKPYAVSTLLALANEMLENAWQTKTARKAC